MKALAVFQDKPDRLLRWMKPGFRHVLVAVEIDDTVVVLDSADGGLHLWSGYCDLKDVADYYRGLKATVVETEAKPSGTLYPTRWTCVEVAKRALGVRAPFVLTPRQLHRRLTCDTE